MPKPSDFHLEEQPVREPGDGEIHVKNRYISLDPAMRGWMTDMKSYVPPVAIGDVMRAFAAGEVLASRDPAFAVGDLAAGMFGVQEHATVPAKQATKLMPIAPLPTLMSALGPPGLTAYFGLLDIGKPQPGETVVVSAAAGAVG